MLKRAIWAIVGATLFVLGAVWIAWNVPALRFLGPFALRPVEILYQGLFGQQQVGSGLGVAFAFAIVFWAVVFFLCIVVLSLVGKRLSDSHGL